VTGPTEAARRVLDAAAGAAGMDATGAVLIRDGSNVLFQLVGGVVARIGRPGSQETAAREVQVARWLATTNVCAVPALDGVPQPTVVSNRPVTWWELLPPHRPGTTAELGAVLRALHALPPPDDPMLPVHDPFAGLGVQLGGTTVLDDSDLAWLLAHLDRLRGQYRTLGSTDASRVVHGDAWQGNVAVPRGGRPILLDFEHVCLGQPDWDLVPIAVDYTDFARLTAEDYSAFVDAYGGHDVTSTEGFRVLAEIQELRWVSYVLSKASDGTAARAETRHRIACLRGEVPRPWTWAAF